MYYPVYDVIMMIYEQWYYGIYDGVMYDMYVLYYICYTRCMSFTSRHKQLIIPVNFRKSIQTDAF